MGDGNPPALMNLVVMEGEGNLSRGGSELTRSNSGAASSLSSENSGHIFRSAVVSGTPGNCAAWTDEMHNKFLDSLEASFVQQLHRSRGMMTWCKEQNRGDKDKPLRFPVSVNKASGKFDHSRDDGWQKVLFGKDHPLPYDAAIEIPWMHGQELAEGSGQNFADGACEDRSNLFSLAMRAKTAVGDT